MQQSALKTCAWVHRKRREPLWGNLLTKVSFKNSLIAIENKWIWPFNWPKSISWMIPEGVERNCVEMNSLNVCVIPFIGKNSFNLNTIGRYNVTWPPSRMGLICNPILICLWIIQTFIFNCFTIYTCTQFFLKLKINYELQIKKSIVNLFLW